MGAGPRFHALRAAHESSLGQDTQRDLGAKQTPGSDPPASCRRALQAVTQEGPRRAPSRPAAPTHRKPQARAPRGLCPQTRHLPAQRGSRVWQEARAGHPAEPGCPSALTQTGAPRAGTREPAQSSGLEAEGGPPDLCEVSKDTPQVGPRGPRFLRSTDGQEPRSPWACGEARLPPPRCSEGGRAPEPGWGEATRGRRQARGTRGRGSPCSKARQGQREEQRGRAGRHRRPRQRSVLPGR